ncbi:MAG: ABC transporter permease [Lewinella sp.]|nr:ABC transporter permease [Lewinella sp.]
MFRHLLKLMWNKRRANSMIFLEILLAFVVLFGVFAFIFYNADRYRSPLGFNYEQTIGVRIDIDDALDSLSVLELQKRIHGELLAMPNVEAATFIGPVSPFGGSTWQTGSTLNGQQIMTQGLFADYRFGEAAQVELTDGRWFTEDDLRGKYEPVVVNAEFKRRYFPNVETIVDSVWDISGEHIIVGVTGDFKYKSNFAENFPLTFYPQMSRMKDGYPFEMMIIRLRPNTLAETEEEIFNLLVDNTKNTEVVIWEMAKDRRKANRPIVIPMVILLVVSGFLLINIALGLFGVLFTQINRRRSEIGLRKAMGATPGQVTTQFVLEILIVTIMALLLGTFFAIQVPLLELMPIPSTFFYYGIVGAIAVIITIVLFCSFLPSRQAAGLHPADVLHEQ